MQASQEEKMLTCQADWPTAGLVAFFVYGKQVNSMVCTFVLCCNLYTMVSTNLWL